MIIVVIDDDTQTRMLTAIRLTRQHKHDVFCAENGVVGLELVHAKRPDCILLDLMMPGMDGFEVLQKLKQDSSTKEIPVFIVSAKRDIDDLEIALHLGATGYITKPIVHENLSDYIQFKINSSNPTT